MADDDEQFEFLGGPLDARRTAFVGPTFDVAKPIEMVGPPRLHKLEIQPGRYYFNGRAYVWRQG